jgi:hypothetical protein
MMSFCGSRAAANVDSAAAVSLYGFMYMLVVHALSANNVLTGFALYNDDGSQSV